MTMVRLDWDERQAAIARMALTQLSYATDTGEERAAIAEMLADLGLSDEDRIRDAMTEAQDHPGRTITR